MLCAHGSGTGDGRARRRGELRNALRLASGVFDTADRKLRTDTSGREEWVVASRAQFATEEEATAAITALWIDEEKYKGTAAQLAALEATNCTATSEDDDDGDEQRPTTVSI